MAVTIPFYVDHGSRNAVLRALMANVVSAGGSITNLDISTGETTPNWVVYLNKISTAVNALGASPALKVYAKLDYSMFHGVVNNISAALIKLGTGGPSSTWSTADASANSLTLSNGGMTAVYNGTNGAWKNLRSSISQTTGKLYVEFLAVTNSAGEWFMGLASAGFNGSYVGSANYSGGATYLNAVVSTGFTDNYAGSSHWAMNNDVFALAVDFTAGQVWMAINNVWANGSNPATGSLPIFSFVQATVGALFPSMSFYNTCDSWTLQPTAASQKYAPPTGFTPWG